MNDAVGPILVHAFYSVLYATDGFDPRRTASALHYAVRELRKERENDFSAWVPFVHIGA